MTTAFPKSIWSESARLAHPVLRPLGVFAALAALAFHAGTANADDRAEVIARLRKAVQEISAQPDEQRAPLSVVELDHLGPAQLALGDLEGALETIRKLSFDGLALPWDTDFLRDLAAALTRSGNGVAPAYEVITLRGDRKRGIYYVQERLAIALGQADAKDVEAAKKTCREVCAAAEPDCDVARIQFRLGDLEGARQSRRLIEAAAKELPPTGQERALLCADMAVMCWEMGDKPSSDRILQEGFRAVAGNVRFRENALRYISAANAKVGNVADAVSIAEQLSEKSSERAEAYASVALLHWSRGDLAAAQKTILLDADLDSDTRDLVLLEIAKAHAQKKEFKQAMATARLVKGDLRRAQTILEAATIQARAGNIEAAAAGVNALDYPRYEREIVDKSPQPFRFEDPGTWGLPFLSGRPFFISLTGRRYDIESEGDLVAAAVGCRIAIKGRGTIPYIIEMNDWDVRKAAEAQAGTGDAAGALEWSGRLPEDRRLLALIGVAEGLAQHERAVNQPPATPRLGSRHTLRQHFRPAFLDE